MAVQKDTSWVIGTDGRPLGGVSVTVYLQGSLTKAMLYSDTALTALANPVVSGTDGSYAFYIDPGRYDLLFAKSGYDFALMNLAMRDQTLGATVPSTLPSYTNNTGVSLAAGDAVGFDPAADSAVVLADTASVVRPIVIAQAAILSGGAGAFLLAGTTTVRTTGAITRGHYAQKSATTKALEDSGVAAATATPPTGAVGVFLTAAVANVATVAMFGFTAQPPATSAVETFSGGALSNTGANIKVDVFSGTSDDATIASRVIISQVASITKTPAAWAVGTNNGGNATGGAVGNNTWYHWFSILRPDTGVVDLAFDTSILGANLIANTNAAYTKKRYLGSTLTDGAAAFLAVTQWGDVFTHGTPITNLNAAPGDTLAHLLTVSTPLGIITEVTLEIVFGAVGSTNVRFSDPATADVAPSIAGGIGSVASLNGVTLSSGTVTVTTNASSQVRYRMSSSVVMAVSTVKYRNRRGRG